MIRVLFLITILLAVGLISCKPFVPKEKDIVKTPSQLRFAISDNIKKRIKFLHSTSEKKDKLFNQEAVFLFYKKNKFKPVWSDSSLWLNCSDSILQILTNAPDNGIDTQYLHLSSILTLISKAKKDSADMNDAAIYARSDLLMTDAYFSYANRICFSQFSPDSIRLRSQKQFPDSMLLLFLFRGLHSGDLTQTIISFEPKLKPYSDLKTALKNYRMDFLNVEFTKVPDTPSFTTTFKSILKTRLLESCDYDSSLLKSDSMKLVLAIKSFQKKHGLFADGVSGKRTLIAMNISPAERINQINQTLDQWRAEPDTFPERYLFVNLPSFNLKYWMNDTVRLESKIICGAVKHNSPLLNSKVNYFILYPFWTVPFSIATKEILPHLQHDTAYLRKQKMDVLNSSREVIDPTKINWKKYSKTYFPFILRQREGLDNSLGVVKFIFPNQYGIYLHETNTRNLFKKDYRALSHGCIRVEQAVGLAYQLAISDSVKFPADSIKQWLDSKTKKQIDIAKKVPLYIRYNLCEAKDGEVIFYEDIYNYYSSTFKKFFPL